MSELKSNQVVANKWRLVKPLGKGGQGAVWEVRPVGVLNAPPSAMKISFDTVSARRQRFEQEADLLSRFSHSNVLKAKSPAAAWEKHIDGLDLEFSFFICELCVGSIDKRPELFGNVMAKVEAFRSICLAVAYLHANKVIHRDLKPENVLVASEPPRLVIGDLGIAKDMAAVTGVTQTHEVVGSKNFRAPETHYDGSSPDVTWDVFSLGRILQWFLTGRTPDTLEAFTGVPRFAEITESLALRLDGIVRRATAPKAQRYPDLDALLRELPDLVVDVRPVSSTPVAVTPPPTVPPTASQAQSSWRERAVEAMRRDRLAWNDLRTLQRRDLSSALTDWREKVLGSNFRQDAVRAQNAESCLQFILPAIALDSVAIRAEAMERVETAGTVARVLAEEWPIGGYVEQISAWELPLFFYHHLIGALLVSEGHWQAAISLANEPARDDKRVVRPLRLCPGVAGRPSYFPAGFKWLVDGSAKVEGVATLFANSNDLQVAFASYSLLLNMLEFSDDVQRLAESNDDSAIYFFTAWPNFAALPEKVVKAAGDVILRGPKSHQWLPRLHAHGADRVWPRWIRSLERTRPGDLFFREQLPLGAPT